MKPSKILIFGAGGHGKVVADLARCVGYTILGYVDRDANKLGHAVKAGGGSVLFTDDTLDPLFATRGTLNGVGVAVALGVGDNTARLGYADRFAKCEMPSLVHPTVAFSRESEIGAGSIVLANAVVNPGTRIGRAVVVNSSAVIEHDCDLGDGAHISPGAVLAGGVRVGARAFIGAQAAVIPGITIGDDAIIGAGAVVLRDVPAGAKVAGNPARPLNEK